MCCISETYHTNKSIPVSSMPNRIDSLFPVVKAAEGATLSRRIRQRAPRRVSFQPTEVDFHEDKPRSSLTQQERNELWYHPTELVGFKIEAREISRRIRTNNPLDDECSRGLEHRISMDRQKNKYLAIRAILKAQDRHSPQDLATIASRCTAWAKEVALLTGHSDYYRCYNPELAHLVPTTPTMSQPLHRKRAVEVIVIDDDSEEEEVRRTRPRLSVEQTSPRRVGFIGV